MWRLNHCQDTARDDFFSSLKFGDAYYKPAWKRVSRYYLEHNSSRAPILVAFPRWDGTVIQWCVDTFNDSKPRGWAVTGSLEGGDLTLSPSVNIKGNYHGWIQDGILSSDVEGRTFPMFPHTV